MGTPQANSFQDCLQKAYEEYLLKEHLDILIHKARSKLSEDYLSGFHITRAENTAVVRHARTDFAEDIQNLLTLLEQLAPIKVPARVSLAEATSLLNHCVRQCHPDTNPQASSYTFQIVYPLIKQLKTYFAHESDERLQKNKKFKSFDRQ